MKIRDIFVPLIAFMALILLWEWASQTFESHQFVLPPPSGIIANIWERSDRFSMHASVTLMEMVGGFALAFAAAFPLAWIMWWWKSASRILQPLFVLIQCIPMFALAPIMVLWFGWGYSAIIIPTALMIFFPLTINIYQGFQATPQHLLEYFRINGATTWQTFSKLQVPWALPHMFAGFRISAAIAGIGAIAGEWAGAQSGLGMLMLESRRSTDLETTFGALLVLSALSFALYGMILLIERKLTHPQEISATIKKYAVCIGMLSLIFGGCNTKEQTQTTTTRLLLDWLPNPNHIPLYVGIEKGYFEKQGIHLILQKITDPSDTVPYITGGRADLALYYGPDTIRANARGAALQPIAFLIKRPLNCLIYRKGEGIQKPSDLSGRRIGYCIGSTSPVLDHILSSNNIQPRETRNVSFDLVSTLGSRKVDAIYGAYWNIESEHLKSLGIETEHFELSELGIPNYYELIILARDGADPQFVAKFQTALQESIDFCTMHPDDAFAIYVEENPDKAPKTLQWEEKAWFKTYPLLADNQDFDADEWSRFIAWFYSNGMLKN